MRIAAILVLAVPLAAGAPQEQEDLLFRVLRDEMARATARLKLEKSGPPYYVEFSATENESFSAAGSFGALTGRSEGKTRYCSIDLRVGDHGLDNTNFAGGGGRGGTGLTIDDDYDALRHELWLATDRQYKSAVEELEKKKAFLQQNTVEDRPDDLSKEEPVVLIQPPAKLTVDKARWSDVVKKVSGVFRDFPRIQKSRVSFFARSETRWFLNNEGFMHRVGETTYGFVMAALIQADDGMKVSDGQLFVGMKEVELPAADALEKAARDLAKRLELVAAAPKAEEYRGPILFEGQAAADFLLQAVSDQAGSSHESLGNRGSGGNPWKDQIGQKVASGFLSITSDPTAKEYNGLPLIGSYDVDEDGVRAQKVDLIEKGVLKTFCMSRIPTRHIKKSNGHSQGGVGTPATLFIKSTNVRTMDKLKEKLFELGRDEGMTHVMIARRLVSPVGGSLDYGAFSQMMTGGRSQITILPPIQLYKVNIETGAEELQRGARFSGVSLRVLRDIAATADDTQARLAMDRRGSMGMIIAPSVLVKEIEISKPGKETEKLPSYPHPLFDGK
ncbi:MAG TPA: metallopeptidase TldD-related protein [Planctomycetota bacterium]|nr:metallopeptidase TldD-related protein [Planctomycetota bacterium]